VRPRQIAPVALIIGLTVPGFFGARLLGERDARRDSDHRAEVAAAQIRGRVERGTSLAESLRRFMVGIGGRGVTSETFSSNTARWLRPAGFPAAAWVEQVPPSRRAAYERRIGHPIATWDRQDRTRPVGARSAYLPATLVSGIAPMAVPGIDLRGEPGVPAALARASTLYDAGATPLITLRDGTQGLFLIRLAPRLVEGVVTPGFVVVFASELWLRAAATDTSTLQLTTGAAFSGARSGANAVHTTFTEAGQRFDVAVARRSVQGAAAVLPWIILAAGLVLAAFAGALGVNAARRARAQDELDRIFTLTPDLIAVADFDGRFTRVNPAVEQVLGYTEEEFLAQPYLDLVHPDDRERTAAEGAAISRGKRALTFENRFRRKDGSHRVLEWTSTPVLEDRLMYGVGRDVTERREAEAELTRLASEQAALRRVATLVARGVPAAEVFSAVAEEVERLLDAQATTIGRLEPDGTMAIVASSGTARDELPTGSHLKLDASVVKARVVRADGSTRADGDSQASELLGRRVRRLGIHCTVAAPIIVEGSLWGAIAAGTERDQFPAEAEQRMAQFTELAATAIANAESRSELTASRARIVAASDETRQQIERDLHDGTQQRLVSLALTLRAAEAKVPDGLDELRDDLSRTANGLAAAVEDLQEISRGIHPAILARGGLGPALKALARRSAVPVEADVRLDDGRRPRHAEVAAYYVVSEALTNAAKHAHASVVRVLVDADDSALRVVIEDDGVGGADPARGSGLIGLSDRVAALGGTLEITSPVGLGTALRATIPIKRDWTS
jgi:PAS domain S-box-containing protein